MPFMKEGIGSEKPRPEIKIPYTAQIVNRACFSKPSRKYTKMGFLYSQLFVTPAYPTKSFANQTVIITGANTGLGKEAARHITRLEASKVIIACRNVKAGEEAKRDILSTTQANASVIEVWQLDLASYDSVKAFADRASKLTRLDALV